ncbi:MAG: TRIC cation channel family protein [Crocinitomicaceae bacterium]|nr:TRIC cation channel family protein [Crocinitomicaceae bacterium]
MYRNIYYALVLIFTTASMGSAQTELKGGWYPWSPYQYLNESGNLEGLDYELITTIFEHAEIPISYDPNDSDTTWDKNQSDVYEGLKAFTGGAFITEERKKKYFISDAYREEWNSLYIRRDDHELNGIHDLTAFIDYLETNKIKVGVVEAYVYSSDVLNDYVRRQKKNGENCLVEVGNEAENFQNQIAGKVRVVFADRLVGANILWSKGWTKEIVPHPIQIPPKTIHLLVHKSDDPLVNLKYKEYLKKFNESLAELKREGVIKQLFHRHLFPVLMSITVQTDWFAIIDTIGIIFFAFSGLLIALDNKFDIFGTLLMTFLLCAGGGVIRDLLVDRPLALLESPFIIEAILIIAFGGFLLFRLHFWLSNNNKAYKIRTQFGANKLLFIRTVIDAMALGAYTLVGVGVAVEMELDYLLIWGPFLGCITACGGGIIARTIAAESKNVALSGSLDPEVSLVLGLCFSQFLLWQTDRLNPYEVFIAVLVTMIASTALLVLVHWRTWRSPKIRK